MLLYTSVLCLVVLLLSNLWLLREVDRLRRQLKLYQREVINLDDRVCRLMIEVDEINRPDPATAVAESERTPG